MIKKELHILPTISDKDTIENIDNDPLDDFEVQNIEKEFGKKTTFMDLKDL